jgi:hypothetical protein
METEAKHSMLRYANMQIRIFQYKTDAQRKWGLIVLSPTKLETSPEHIGFVAVLFLLSHPHCCCPEQPNFPDASGWHNSWKCTWSQKHQPQRSLISRRLETSEHEALTPLNSARSKCRGFVVSRPFCRPSCLHSEDFKSLFPWPTHLSSIDVFWPMESYDPRLWVSVEWSSMKAESRKLSLHPAPIFLFPTQGINKPYLYHQEIW